MTDLTFSVSKLAKRFNRRTIFSAIEFSLSSGQSLSIVGRNGIGKSTLLKTMTGILSPTSGSVAFTVEGKDILPTDIYKHLGFVSPYLQLYDEFSGIENLALYCSMRNQKKSQEELELLLQRFTLWNQRDDLVRTYSSGMKQRLKYAAALVYNPHLLVLDEPTSNLDEEGQGLVRACIEEQKKKGIVIIATNNKDEFAWCDRLLDLGEGKN